MRPLRTLFAAAGAALLGLGLLVAPANEARAAGVDGLRDAVTSALLARAATSDVSGLRAADQDDTRVTITRHAGRRWAWRPAAR
ncbi:hypothetical protein GA0070622_2785 [Micromonospora sediminicola]|uniref:Uncharacterized protein n=1 Tax=Micromonospora sediminicola TaxID=946078 RepID=A0A1A9B9M6_9ACTN|nr:hypothetical protein [Micromonospora sediminicola]SBT65776.1 hypothetical protein GA0070622_2785 [Micromonospora sediminicola]